MKYYAGVALGLCAISAIAQERVYPVVDAQGRVQMLKSKTTTPSAEATPAPVTPNNSSPFTTLDNEVYVDSDYLEQKSFNLEDKKRFYFVPNGTGSQQLLQSLDGQLSHVTEPILASPKRRMAFYAQDYLSLSATWLAQNAPVTQSLCQHPKKLKKAANPFKKSNALWLNTDPSMPRFDRVLGFGAPSKQAQHLRITAFASSNKKPQFYVPMISFLDANGCVIAGAWQYWSQAYPANEHHFSAIEGLLSVPSATQYIAFLAPIASLNNELPQTTTGSLMLENE